MYYANNLDCDTSYSKIKFSDIGLLITSILLLGLLYRLEGDLREIKHILEYDYNYAEYIVTDGKYDIVCMCFSVPLENNNDPKIGMKVDSL